MPFCNIQKVNNVSFYNDADNEGNDNGDDDDDDCDYVLMKFFVEICRLDESFSGGTHIAMKHKSDKKVTRQVNENQCDNILYNKIMIYGRIILISIE